MIYYRWLQQAYAKDKRTSISQSAFLPLTLQLHPPSLHPSHLFIPPLPFPTMLPYNKTKPWLRGCCYARLQAFPELIQFLSRMYFGGFTANSGHYVPQSTFRLPVKRFNVSKCVIYQISSALYD